MILSEDFLLAVAAIAISLIGFSGVVTALGRRGEGKWTTLERLQLQTLVEPSLVALFGAFSPIVVGLAVPDQEMVWRISNGILLVFHVVAFGLFLVRSKEAVILRSHKLLSVLTCVVLLFQLSSVLNLTVYHQLAFAISLLLGIGVGVHNFYLLLFIEDAESA